SDSARPASPRVRGGVGRLLERRGREIESADVRLRCPAVALDRRDDAYLVRPSGANVPADRVLVAIPAPFAAQIVEDVSPHAADALAGIRFGASVVVQLRYEPTAVGRPLDGAGYLVPREEGLVHAACSWSSAKWGHGDETWLRAVVT